MKRHELERHLKRNGCALYREGKAHTLYWNPENGNISALPRHVEIKNTLARKICKDLGVPNP